MKVRGFTLIEMLVALAIFSLMLAVLLGGYSQGLNIWQRAADQSGQWQAYQYRYLWLSRMTQQLVAADYRLTRTNFADYFSGDATGFVAMSSAPILSPLGRPVPVELRLVDNLQGSVQLMYREGTKNEDPERGINFDRQPWVPLLTDINNAQFRYYTRPIRESDVLDGQALPPYQWLPTASWVPRQIELSFVSDDPRGNPQAHSWLLESQNRTDSTYLFLMRLGE